ncbi:MAG: polyprenyl synthetase family protein [Rhodospirillaceae bacterium]|nr:polyprenyl synthetase family protein [Rhodospirillaceae bacterium]
MTVLAEALETTARLMNDELDRHLPISEGPERPLQEAMRYACLDGGKRLRPFLVLETAKLFNVAERAALRTAAAIELVHCYSLVHDDLPAMDDDDLRRGRPTCHKAFDEATAILAGDALLTKAFEVLAGPATHPDPQVRCELVWELATASGDRGMVGGQMFDLRAGLLDMDVQAVTRLQQMKTGRLIGFACEAGAILGKAPASHRQALKMFAHDLGLAFQIADDILDIEGSAEEVGKALHKDADAGKATFVSLIGVERARLQANALAAQAIQHLEVFDDRARLLRAVASYVVERRH